MQDNEGGDIEEFLKVANGAPPRSLTQRISNAISGNNSQKSILSEMRASETPPMPSSTDCITSGGPLSDEDERKAYLEIYSKVCSPVSQPELTHQQAELIKSVECSQAYEVKTPIVLNDKSLISDDKVKLD